MRILMTTDTIGGVWTVTQELTQGLLDEGHNVALISFGRMPSDAQTMWTDTVRATHGDSFCYRPSGAPLEWMERNTDAFTAAEPELQALTASFCPDLIHSHQYCFGAFKSGVPVLVSAHSDVLSWATACRPAGLEDSLWLRQYKALVQTGLDQSAAVIAPTSWMLEALGSGFCLPQQTGVVLNGRTPAPPPEAQPRLQAVSAGRLWDEAKNVKLLADLNTRMPLVVAGEGTLVGSQLSHVGLLDEQAMLALFSASAVYVCTSKYEPFGLAPLEAALCGCAVVAHDLASLREVWGDAALYFAGAADLERLLDRLHDEPEFLAAQQKASSERASRFSRECMTAGYLEWYGAVVGRHQELSDAS